MLHNCPRPDIAPSSFAMAKAVVSVPNCSCDIPKVWINVGPILAVLRLSGAGFGNEGVDEDSGVEDVQAFASHDLKIRNRRWAG